MEPAPADRLLNASNRLPIAATTGEGGVSFTQASGGLAHWDALLPRAIGAMVWIG